MYSVGYKKYICGDFFEGKVNFSIKKAVKNNINKMIENNIFDIYIADYEKEIKCIGDMYLKEEEKRLKNHKKR